MDKTQIIDFAEFSSSMSSGISVVDTFDTWRKKTNGIIEKIVEVNSRIDPFYANSTPYAVLIGEKQTITGVKTFAPGTKSSPILKVGEAGFYNDGTGICVDSLKVEKLINSSPNIKLGGIEYILPHVNPSENSILIKSGNSLSWQNYNTVVDLVKQEGTVKILTVNEILPVGAIISQSISSAPNGWLPCSGERFKGSDYPDLAKALLNTYGKIYTTRTGNTEASSVRYNDSWYYTLPNLNGRVLVGSGLANDGTESKNFILGSSGGKFSHGLITNELPTIASKVVSDEDGDVIYGLDLGASGSLHNNTPPYTSTFYIIKAERDSVVNTFINRGNVLTFVKENLESIENIDMLTGGNTTINLNYDSSLTVNDSRELGLADYSVSAEKIQRGSVYPDKMSQGGPSWDPVTAALYEGSDPILRKRVATQEYINQLLSRKGPVKKLAEKYQSAIYSSVGNDSEFCYITDSGSIVVNGDNNGSRFGYSDKYAHTELHLPANRKADKLYVQYDSIAVLDTEGELWFMGTNRSNMYNTVPNVSVAKTWTKAFTPLYDFGSNNKIDRVIISSEPLQSCTVAVIDTSDRLWVAGRNTYGVNGKGNKNATSTKANGETSPAINDITDAILMGGDEVAPGGSSIAYETILAIGKNGRLYGAGYNKKGVLGNGTDLPDNVTFGSGILISGVDITNSKLYSSGQGQSQTVYLVSEDGSQMYAWGSGGLIGNEAGNTVSFLTPQKVWDAKNSNNNNTFRDKIINKVYTTNSKAMAATYVLCQSLNTASQVSNTITINNRNATDIGRSVSMSDDGNTIAFGGSTSKTGSEVFVYSLVNGAWVQKGASISSPISGRYESFGACVALSGNGNRIAISSPDYDTSGNSNGPNNGLVRVYEFISGTWKQVGTNIVGDLHEHLGMFDGTLSLNQDGSILAIGIPNYTQYPLSLLYQNYGRVKIYKLSLTNGWVAYGTSSAGVGQIRASQRYDHFGYAIKLNSAGDRIAISAPGHNANDDSIMLRKYSGFFWYRRWWLRDYWGQNRGAVRVYRLNGTNWEQMGSTIYGMPNQEIGRTLSFSGDGNRVAYSARLTSTNTVVRIHEYISQNWLQIGLDINSDVSKNEFGASICLNYLGDRIAISAPDNSSTETGRLSGRVRVYGLQGNSWYRISNNIDGDASVTDEDFGASVYLNATGDRVVIGAPGSKSVEVYQITSGEFITELWCIGENTGGKFGGLQGPNTNNRFLETELASDLIISDFWCGNGFNKNTINFVKAYRPSDKKYYLFAAGENSNFESGIGSNLQLSTFTEINLASDIIERIIDFQSISNYNKNGKYTVLHLDDGRLYFAGHNKYMIDPNLPESYYRSNFTRIK